VVDPPTPSEIYIKTGLSDSLTLVNQSVAGDVFQGGNKPAGG